MLRVVFDTNIYLSALFWSGNPRKCVVLAKLNKIQAFSSPPIIEEIRAKLTGKFNVELEDAAVIIGDILSYTTLITPMEGFESSLADPTDQKFIDCALASKSQYIVSGDKHLLALKQIKHINILPPTDFLPICRFLTA